jgi:Mg2+/Co2+ transporter CorB
MPEEPSLILLAISLIFLLILSAFFSGSETGMMASNKIKLRNKVKKGSNSSKRALELLSRPDNLLSVILVGNNFANILASAIVTIIMINFFEGRVLLGSVLLTIIILIFSEITPKTTASAYPEEFASKSSWLLDKFSRILNPFIYIINQFSSRILNLLKVDIKKSKESDNLNVDELKTLLEDKNTQISSDFKSMLSSILDMDQLTVEDMMVPLSDIVGINTKDSIDEIKQIIEKSS